MRRLRGRGSGASAWCLPGPPLPGPVGG